MSSKKKVAILGGGMSSLTSALELTRDKDWKSKYEITIYQMGWRLGGKTSTGRGPNDRIEEHGIHILQGWYDNTFELLKEVYAERREFNLAPECPFQEWEQGFDRNDSTFLTYQEDGKWLNWPMVFPRNPMTPGKGKLPIHYLIRKLAALGLEFIIGSPFQKVKGRETLSTKLLRKIFFRTIDPGYNPNAVSYNPKDELKTAYSMKARLKRTGTLLSFTWVILKGILKDVIDWKTFKADYSRINHLDFRVWLKKNGASEQLADSVLVRFAYTGTFANLGSGNLPGGAISAGVALQFFVQSIQYKGSFVWQFKAGTGETMISPVYEVLKHRGVNFKFFHKVEKIHYSQGTDIETITISKQVNLSVAEYVPCFKAKGFNAWPSEPLYDQINPEEVKKLKEKKINLESPWADWQPVETKDLQKGMDFDIVILGIPIGVLPQICPEIIEQKPDWKKMTSKVQTIPTQSVQFWLKPNLKELGMHLSQWGMGGKACQPNVVTYADSMYSWLDSTEVLKYENWPKDNKPGMIAYYTGSLKAELRPFSHHNFQHEENERLKKDFKTWLEQYMGYFWSDGCTNTNPNGLDLNLLLLPENASGSSDEKYNAQFFRANVSPTDHYTLSVPDSDQFRLKADQSGYKNLILTGDWINFGLNVGYIEGTIISGMQAAEVVKKG